MYVKVTQVSGPLKYTRIFTLNHREFRERREVLMILDPLHLGPRTTMFAEGEKIHEVVVISVRASKGGVSYELVGVTKVLSHPIFPPIF